ncbi:Phage protein [Yersinia phage fPS-50]|uniref:Phage protein n=2 Tax=Helsettvirus fPS9 TaxID=2733625 RepID=A0A2D0PE15_9CAUD|nr:Phage protein [Yersinia phage fPS-52]SOO46715.1 Phage protein [Yersinia phage fPS-50]
MSACVIWSGAKLDGGYGITRYEGRTQTAHRVAYKKVNGDIPKGMVIMHLCDNPSCVNPKHLKLGTQAQNRQDCVSKGRANVSLGEAHYNSKLTAALVLEIRSSTLNNTELAELYGIAWRTVSDARRGKTWRSI